MASQTFGPKSKPLSIAIKSAGPKRPVNPTKNSVFKKDALYKTLDLNKATPVKEEPKAERRDRATRTAKMMARPIKNYEKLESVLSGDKTKIKPVPTV